MMGTKERHFAPLVNISLEALVPQDHFYRHLEHTLDLSFVREFVHETYASKGRPSIDPIVFFKLQLVMFFEGIRSERQRMQHAADRLSVRWYLGYDLGEPLPDHSSLTRIRERYGVDVFRRFFEAIVEQCQQAGLVWGRELYIDGTQVNANADLDSLTPRFAVEAREAMQAHLAALFSDEDAQHEQQETVLTRQTQKPLHQSPSAPHLSHCPSSSPKQSKRSALPRMRPGTTGSSKRESRSGRSVAITSGRRTSGSARLILMRPRCASRVEARTWATMCTMSSMQAKRASFFRY